MPQSRLSPTRPDALCSSRSGPARDRSARSRTGSPSRGPAVSQHLRVLKGPGSSRDERPGRAAALPDRPRRARRPARLPRRVLGHGSRQLQRARRAREGGLDGSRDRRAGDVLGHRASAHPRTRSGSSPSGPPSGGRSRTHSVYERRGGGRRLRAGRRRAHRRALDRRATSRSGARSSSGSRPTASCTPGTRATTPDDPVTEVELRFVAVGDATRVELEHRGWEALAKAEETRNSYAEGWPVVLGRFAAATAG